jgi:pimeloyl-ACP methyl ester carboxylesterase
MLGITLLISASLLATAIAASGEQRMIGIGDRRVSVYCGGKAARSPTVILIPAGGRTAKDWATIQPAVSAFTRVCSYDHANFGESGKAPVKLQSVDDVVDDLHAWLQASGEKEPFILVSHSNSGFYARRFVTRYPREAAGLVFVDSAHEEQALRLHELDPQGPRAERADREAWLVYKTRSAAGMANGSALGRARSRNAVSTHGA